MSSTKIGTRRSVRDLQTEYDRGNKKPLEDVIRAWKGIKELPPSDLNSFFVLGGYHGEPFEVRKAVDALSTTDVYLYWGGWCNHGNVLFPTWHRAYLHRLEQALQSIVPGVMLPFWDETNEESLSGGIPSILTQEKVELDGELIDNPLHSFTLPAHLSDDFWADNTSAEKHQYAKPKGYQTVRYPLSGLVGNAIDREATRAHNAKYPDPVKNTALLNRNVMEWLHHAGPNGLGPNSTDPDPSGVGIYSMFEACLRAPNYTVFSNTTSAAAWNRDNTNNATMVVPLEQPHNDIHLSVGGFDAPNLDAPPSSFPHGSGQIAGSNGDMGENNTAALDPIFFFHHCNIDRVFWLWQKQHVGRTICLEILDGYKGTSASDAEGPTTGVAPGTKLDMTTSLAPFEKADGMYYTSMDCINIETQLGFTYAPGSLEARSGVPSGGGRKLTVRGIDRALFEGSFVVRAYASVKGADGASVEYDLGHHAVLCRRDATRCANCLTHMEVIAHFSLDCMPADAGDNAHSWVEIQHRGAGIPVVPAGQSHPAASLPAGLTINLNVTA